MNNKLLLSRLTLIGFLLLFFTGCFTQLSSVKKTSKRDYGPPREEIVYEDEYQEEGDTVYVEEEQTPVYQYNFYGYDPFDNYYYSPYYSGISFYFGDPWYYDPWYSSYGYGNRGWGMGWGGGYNQWGYGGYRGGYYGYSSPYYGTYDSYWGYGYRPYGNFVEMRPQKRRNFDYRRGLAGRTDTGTDPKMSTVSTRGNTVSRIERIRKTTKPDNRGQMATVTTRERTRKTDNSKPRTVSTKPVRKKSNQERLTRTPNTIRSKTRTKPSTSRSGVTSKPRTTKSVPSVNRNTNRTRTKPKSKSSSGVSKSRTTKTYSPPASRSRSGSSGKSRGTTYKPRTSSSSGSSGRITRSSTGSKSSSGSKSKGSSSRTKKK